MDLELQTICVVRPVYFTAVVLLLLAVTLASGISAVIAMARRIRRTMIAPKHINRFHLAVVLVWLAYTIVVSVGWINGLRTLREYEETTARAAPAVRAAITRETRVLALVGATCVGVGLLSMVAWRGMARDRTNREFA